MAPIRSTPHHADYIWQNGEFLPWDQATVHLSAMGASAGVAVFEGIKGYWNAATQTLNVIRLERHLQRLVQSMRMMRMRTELDEPALTAAIVELCQKNHLQADTYIRPVAYYSGAEHLSYGDTVGEIADVMIWTRPFKTILGTHQGYSASVSSWMRIVDNSVPARIKCMSNYQNNRLALVEAKLNGYDTCVMLRPDGTLSEGHSAAIFLVRDGTVITPPVTAGILESVTRDSLIRWFREVFELPCVERDVDRTELYVADEIIQCGTGAEISAITSIDRLAVGTGAMGPIGRRVEDYYDRFVRGQDSAYARWRTPVRTMTAGIPG